MREFEVIEHTADTGICARGSSMKQVFVNCALGMMSIMLEPESVRPAERICMEAKGRSPESLLLSWLGEILFQVEAEGWAFGEFGVTELTESKARGWGLGEPLDPERHGVKLEIKAPTYHMLELKEEEGRWKARVIFDV